MVLLDSLFKERLAVLSRKFGFKIIKIRLFDAFCRVGFIANDPMLDVVFIDDNIFWDQSGFDRVMGDLKLTLHLHHSTHNGRRIKEKFFFVFASGFVNPLDVLTRVFLRCRIICNKAIMAHGNEEEFSPLRGIDDVFDGCNVYISMSLGEFFDLGFFGFSFGGSGSGFLFGFESGLSGFFSCFLLGFGDD